MNKDKSQLKVLFALPALDAGGAERVLITLMNGLNREKYSPEFLSVRGDGPLQDLIDPSIPVHRLDKNPVPFVVPFLPALYKKMKEIKPDIVVATMTHMNFAVLMLKPFFPDTTFIVREAITPSFLLQKYAKTNWVIKGLYKTLYPKADLVLSPTQTVFDEFYHELDMQRDNFILLKNPVNQSKIRNSIELVHAADEKKKTVRFVACGRLGKQKGFDRLIESLDRFETTYPWRLDILGEGYERPFLEGLIKSKGLEDKVFLKGLVMPPYSYMAQADCFLMPSRFEGLPNAVLESLACGTPVIATRESGGIEEIAKDCSVENVCIVDSMDEFIEEMGRVLPQDKDEVSPSLLAECYDQKKVFDAFEHALHLATIKSRDSLAAQKGDAPNFALDTGYSTIDNNPYEPEFLRKVILNVGRLDAQKDQKILIKAFSQIAPYFPEWDLRIVGEGELKEELETLIGQYGLEERVFLTGLTGQIAVEYEAADIFAISSRYESFGLATTEALFHGLPVLGFADCPGINDVIQSGYNGVLVSSHDRAGVFAKGLQHLIQNPALRARYGMNGTKSVESFDEERVTRNRERLMSQIRGNIPLKERKHQHPSQDSEYGVIIANQNLEVHVPEHAHEAKPSVISVDK